MPLFQRESKCEIDLHENETACRTHFHMKGFALRLVLKQRHKITRKWPISKIPYYCNIKCIYDIIGVSVKHVSRCSLQTGCARMQSREQMLRGESEGLARKFRISFLSTNPSFSGVC